MNIQAWLFVFMLAVLLVGRVCHLTFIRKAVDRSPFWLQTTIFLFGLAVVILGIGAIPIALSFDLIGTLVSSYSLTLFVCCVTMPLIWVGGSIINIDDALDDFGDMSDSPSFFGTREILEVNQEILQELRKSRLEKFNRSRRF